MYERRDLSRSVTNSQGRWYRFCLFLKKLSSFSSYRFFSYIDFSIYWFLRIKKPNRNVRARALVYFVYSITYMCMWVYHVIVSCFFLLTNLEYLRVGSFSFSGVVGDPTQAGKNKTHVTFSHGKNTKAQSEVGRIRRTCHELLNDLDLPTHL